MEVQMPNDKQINVRNIPADVLAKAQKIAEKTDESLARVIRRLLREYVAENEQKLKQPAK
jgi:chorismate mutase